MPQVIVKKRKVKEATKGLEGSRRLAKHVLSLEKLHENQMLPSMSRPANPYDNATCKGFLKTLKHEERSWFRGVTIIRL